MVTSRYDDIVLEIVDRIGIIKFNRPNSLNSFGGNLIPESISALNELNSHPDTVFTVLTGEGRFFSAGADVEGVSDRARLDEANLDAKRLALFGRFVSATELLKTIIKHRKVFVLALNGPAVGGAAAWFPGLADVTFAAQNVYLQVPFSELGLVPEYGSAVTFAQNIGITRANDFFIFGRKLNVDELQQWGLVNYVLPTQDFHAHVLDFLRHQLQKNDGKSMMESKRLVTEPLKSLRLAALHEAADALAERFLDGTPTERFKRKAEQLSAKRKEKKASKI